MKVTLDISTCHGSKWLTKSFVIFILAWLSITACDTPQIPITAEPLQPIPTTPTPENANLNTQTPIAQSPTPFLSPPTPTSLPSPTAVSRTAVSLFLPDNLPQPWRETTLEVIGRLQSSNLLWEWNVTADLEKADLTLQPGSEGLFIFEQPVALTVPFTTDWEAANSTQAAEILQNGHPLVTVTSWEAMPANYKALRIDGLLPNDANYPLQQPWSITFKEDKFIRAAADLQYDLNANPPVNTFIQLTAVGDIMLDRSLGGAIAAGNLTYPFEDVAHLLTSADITVGNLESALGDIGQPAPKSYTFRAPPAAAQALALAGFDVVSLANNHGMDYGPETLLQAIDLLRQQNVAPIGAGANASEAHTPHIQEVNGLRLAFLGFVHVPVEGLTGFDVETWNAAENSPGLAWAYPEQITADVTAARQQADLVIVILHSGYEYINAPSPPQTAASHAAIDAGASLVIGHHAHILQGIEFYNDGVIVYGLGNFAFEINGDPSTAVLNVWLDQNGVHQIELIPALIQFGGQPRPAEPYEAHPILQQVYFLTTLLNPQ